MKTDLHIHTSTGSDGALTLEELFNEASDRGIELISVTDHGAVHHQGEAVRIAAEHNIRYVTGVELNVSFPYGGKDISLDFLGYGYDYRNPALNEKLEMMKKYDEERALKVLDKLNHELEKESIPLFTEDDLAQMQEGIEGILSRPHIADYLVRKNIVSDRQEAFDRYLVACNVPRYPLRLEDASRLIREAGGILSLAHPSDPNGTSLAKITLDLDEQSAIIRKGIFDYIDGIECWHSRMDGPTTAHYVEFCRVNNLMMTGGSDCHQKPMLLGTVDVPDFVAEQFLTMCVRQ
ncbi:MAG: PHP domain-containing protein [Acidobacteria bacterium]|nr:PHP domain-containing protein [Acidobacteriota bacterium]